ncbi:MAG: hypothetical protein NPIRA05_17050 [Nitrospirales bacterium]|nr:MAG: hypothetical protein NPIRA05_17050 [Nitrospirales bacterium]
MWVPKSVNDVTAWQESGATAKDFQALLDGAVSVPATEQAEVGKESLDGAEDPVSEIARLATLSPIEYAKARKDAAKRLGIGLQFLDKFVKAQRREQGQGKTPQGQEVTFPDILPADEAVDGAAWLDRITAHLRQFLVLPVGAPEAIALWVLHSYVYDAFRVNPRLALLSPEKRCGKSTTLDLLGDLVPRPLLASNITPSSLFRVIEKVSPTLILDEVDSFQDANEELRGILNSGHTKTAARVIRSVGDDHEPRAFSTWCPMILAAIGGLPDTLEDRSIIVRIQRKKPTAQVARLTQRIRDTDAFKATVEAIRRQATRWAADHLTRLDRVDPPTMPELSDRANDNWSGLLVVAALCGEGWAKRAHAAALTLSGKEASSSTIGEQLLADIQLIFKEKEIDRISSTALCDALTADPEKPWATWSRGYPITMIKVARLLSKHGITSKPLNLGGEQRAKGYMKEQFVDAWERYLSSSHEDQLSTSYGVTSCMNKGENPYLQLVTEEKGNYLKNGALANTGADCNSVTFQNTKTRTEEENAGEPGVLFYGEEEEFDVDV